MKESDLELLRKYSQDGSEEAFAEVVQRHVDMVFSTALRQLSAPELAQEVCQTVFLDLARNIPRLKADTVLGAWLYKVTRRAAADLIRAESRRQVREQIAYDMNTGTENSATEWDRIQPVLDDGLAELEELDRTAILLRFLQGKSFREVGFAMGVSDDAAQKRVSRALDRLRSVLHGQGVTVSAGALGVILSTQALQAAPIGLVSTITGTVASAISSGASVSLVSKTILLTTLKKSLVTVVIVGSMGLAVYEMQENRNLRTQINELQAAKGHSEPDLAGAIESFRTNDALLAESLANLERKNNLLTLERNEAKRLAQIYRELAETRKKSNATNPFPTRRHLTAGFGRIVRAQMLNGALIQGKAPNNLTADERSAMTVAAADSMTEMAAIIKAANELKAKGEEDSVRDPVDDMAVFAYGMLNLDESQFQQAYLLFKELNEGVIANNLAVDDLSASNQAVLKSLNERGMAALQKMLHEDQLRLWNLLTSTSSGGLLGKGGLFQNFAGKNAWEKLLHF